MPAKVARRDNARAQSFAATRRQIYAEKFRRAALALLGLRPVHCNMTLFADVTAKPILMPAARTQKA